VSEDLMLAIATVAALNAARDRLLIRTMQFGLREGHRAATAGGVPLSFEDFQEQLRPDVDAFTDALNAEIIATGVRAYQLGLREQGVTADACRARGEALAARLRRMAEVG
jgi:hypothetical protein